MESTNQQTQANQEPQPQPAHRIGRIIQVMIARHMISGQQLESRFKVQLRCQCCFGQVVICTRSQLINIYAISEIKVRQIEQIALRQQKLRETKQNSDELMSFLGFSDIDDFSNLEEEAFIDCSNFGEVCTSNTNNLPQNIVTLSTSSDTSPIKDQSENLNRCLRVGEKRGYFQREMTSEEVDSPMPRGIQYTQTNEDEVQENDSKRMQLLSQRLQHNYDSTKVNNIEFVEDKAGTESKNKKAFSFSNLAQHQEIEEEKDQLSALHKRYISEDYSIDNDSSHASPIHHSSNNINRDQGGFVRNVIKQIQDQETQQFNQQEKKREQKQNQKIKKNLSKFSKEYRQREINSQNPEQIFRVVKTQPVQKDNVLISTNSSPNKKIIPNIGNF